MIQNPSYYKIGEKCCAAGYDWSDNRMFCWKQNWHIPIRRDQSPSYRNIKYAFMYGISTYSLVEKTIRGISFPFLILRFNSPTSCYITATNSKTIYPATLFDIHQRMRNKIHVLFIDKGIVVEQITFEIVKKIMVQFHDILDQQQKQLYSDREFQNTFNEYLKTAKIKELYMRGIKGHVT